MSTVVCRAESTHHWEIAKGGRRVGQAGAEDAEPRLHIRLGA